MRTLGGGQAEGRSCCIVLSREKEPGTVSKVFCSHENCQPVSCKTQQFGSKWGRCSDHSFQTGQDAP